MKEKFHTILLVIISMFLSSVLFAADPSSANFQIVENYFSGGRQDTESNSYKIADGGIDQFARAASSSAHYAVEGKAGISGVEKIPYINSITPGNNSRFFTDQTASYTVSATTPDGDTLQYRVKQDGSTKAGPQSSSTLSWSLAAGDRGRHTHTFEVIDPNGTVVKQQSNYVFRRPVK